MIVGTMSTTELTPDYSLIRPMDMVVCGIVGPCWPGYMTPEPTVVGNALVDVVDQLVQLFELLLGGDILWLGFVTKFFGHAH